MLVSIFLLTATVSIGIAIMQYPSKAAFVTDLFRDAF